MHSGSNSLLEKLNESEMDIALFIYIGQNIRDEGILKDDPVLKEDVTILDSLIDHGIVERNRWYKFEVLRISYRFTVIMRTILENQLRGKRGEIQSTLQTIPENVLSFLVYEYLSKGLSFPVTKDWIYDWMSPLVQNETIKRSKMVFFTTLIDLGFCVRTNSYVSTRGGELRDEEFVISAEVRKLLQEITSHKELPTRLVDLAAIHNLIIDSIEYQEGTVEVDVRDVELEKLGTLDSIKVLLNDLLERMNAANAVYETRTITGFGIEIVANRDVLYRFIREDTQDQIVEQLLSKEFRIPDKEKRTREPDFLRMVQTLIDRKFSLYKTAAQFSGREIFKSLPYIERCVIDLTNPPPGEEGLRRFVGNLHQVLEESSTKEVLKFREGETFTSLEEWLEIEIPLEASSLYEDAQEFFRDLNRLRNYYSHAVDAKGIFEVGLIFSRLIGKYSPDEEEMVGTEAVLLERSIRALESLDRALRIVWQKKIGSSLF